MSDQPELPIPAAPAAPAPAAAPAAPAAAPQTASTAQPATLPSAAPVVEGAASVADPTGTLAEAPAEVKAEPKSLLGDLLAGDEPAPVEAPKPEPISDLPAYEAFTLPEGIQLDPKLTGDFSKVLGEFEKANNVPHEAAQALGQSLVDFYLKEQKATTERFQAEQLKTWEKTRETWVEEFRSDPEIGRNRQETTIKNCGALLEKYAASVGKDEAKALRETFSFTGGGDNVRMIRFLNWMSRFVVETAKPIPAGKAPPAPPRGARGRYANSPTLTNGAA